MSPMSLSGNSQKISFTAALLGVLVVGFLLGNSAPRWYAAKPMLGNKEMPHSETKSTDSEMKNMAPSHSEHPTVVVPDGEKVPQVSLQVGKDKVSGWNVHVQTKNFAFSPENASGDHVFGQGHAHIYVDEVKVARLYGNWFHIAELKPGKHEVKVTLNANNHAEYVVGDRHIEATTEVVVE